MLWAVGLAAVGVLAVRDALMATPWIDGRPWSLNALEALGRLQPTITILVIVTAIGVAGLVLLLLALWPRRKRGLPLSAAAGTYIGYRHLGRLLSARIETLDGVVSARALPRRRAVHAHVRGVDGINHDELQSRVQDVMREELTVMRKPIRSSVRITEGSGT